MVRPNPAQPSQTKRFVIGVVASLVVVALALTFVMRRGAQNQQAAVVETPALETATQAAASETTQAPVPSPLPEESEEQLAAVPRISIEDVLKDAASGIVIIDVRDAQAYLAGHIDGALHIPAQYLQGEMPYLPKDRPIITYCT